MERVNKPLTLEQLRGMANKPVWLHTFSSAKKITSVECWALVAGASEYSVSFVRVAVAGRMEKKCEDYGKTWLAYAKQPAHIDREKWGPCEDCEEKLCENCQSFHLASWKKPCKECAGKSNWQPASKYCPWCGRPLTEEAWVELERRVFGE